jgi:hypothetical protein
VATGAASGNRKPLRINPLHEPPSMVLVVAYCHSWQQKQRGPLHAATVSDWRRRHPAAVRARHRRRGHRARRVRGRPRCNAAEGPICRASSRFPATGSMIRARSPGNMVTAWSNGELRSALRVERRCCSETRAVSVIYRDAGLRPNIRGRYVRSELREHEALRRHVQHAQIGNHPVDDPQTG